MTLFEIVLHADVFSFQFAQSLGFDLPDPLSGYIQLFANFFQSSGSVIIQAVPQMEYLLLSL